MINRLISLAACAAALLCPSLPGGADACAQTRPDGPIGWAALEGTAIDGSAIGATTGAGPNAPHVVARTFDELIAAMKKKEPLVVYIDGTLETTQGMQAVKRAKDKTIIGLPGATLVNNYTGTDPEMSGILKIRECQNIIIRNLTFKAAGAYDMDGRDNMELQQSNHIWVDHCDFQDGVDGNLDCNNASDNITVSWCRFRYLKPARAGGSGGSDDHRFSDLWGGSDNAADDEGRLRTTFAFCWWDEGCRERMPRVRFGQVHILNCLYASRAAKNVIGGGYRSNLYVENSVFDLGPKAKAWRCYADKRHRTDYNVTAVGCLGLADMRQQSGDIAYFVPADHYAYKALPASDVRALVADPAHGAGATLSTALPTGGSNAVPTAKSAVNTAVNSTADNALAHQPLSTLSALKKGPVGWAMIDGQTTGGENGEVVVVRTFAELLAAMGGTEPRTVVVDGTLTTRGVQAIENAQNKTLIGLPGATLQNPDGRQTVEETGVLVLRDCRNIILRNLTFVSAGSHDIDGRDNLTVNRCQYLWVDHCDFQDGVDGNFDCNLSSDYVCVSWCRFRYLKKPMAGGSGGNDNHSLSNLWGSGDRHTADEGHLRTTFAFCWWDEGCRERMPRVRYGRVHILNCLYSSTVANYCVGAGYKSNIYIEGCCFKNQQKPWANYAYNKNYPQMNITVAEGNIGAPAHRERMGDIDFFEPAQVYAYTAEPAARVEALVADAATGAGATLTVDRQGAVL